jgi:hypothetical protein
MAIRICVLYNDACGLMDLPPNWPNQGFGARAVDASPHDRLKPSKLSLWFS